MLGRETTYHFFIRFVARQVAANCQPSLNFGSLRYKLLGQDFQGLRSDQQPCPTVVYDIDNFFGSKMVVDGGVINPGALCPPADFMKVGVVFHYDSDMIAPAQPESIKSLG